MRRAALALLLGESLVLVGLWLAWPPLAFVVAGGQLVAASLMSETGGDA